MSRASLNAIREKCMDCTCGQTLEVKDCIDYECPLWKYRMGKDPDLKRNYTDEQRKAIKERLNKKKLEE